MQDMENGSAERIGLTALAALLLAPVVAHGAWRPLGHVSGAAGDAVPVTCAALAVAAITVLSGRLRRDMAWLPPLAGGLTATAATAALSLGAAGLLTLLAVAALSAPLTRLLPPRLPPALDGLAARNKGLTALYLAAALISVVSVARVSTFIGDPSRVDLQAIPGERFTETHSCLTAYLRAADLIGGGVDNLYDDRWWHGSHGLPPRPAGSDDPYRPFDLDNFSYPPTFLLVMPLLAPLHGDFLAQRALWFGIDGLIVALGLWSLARWIDGPRAHRALLLAPLLFGSAPMLLMLQIGNFHPLAVVLSVLAMVAFDRKRTAAGGALLALTILSKISPGVLGIVLLVQRRFRSAAAAAGAGALLLGLSVLNFGLSPLRYFLSYALPRLSSGRAFPFMDTETGINTNTSPFGVPFKLEVIGLDVGEPWQVGAYVARAFTLLLVALAVAGARHRGDRRDQAIRWMSLLVLAAMQMPFSPAYATVGLLWATTLLSVEVRRARHAIALIALWPAILFTPPGLAPAQQAALSIAQTAVTISVSAWLVLRAPRTVSE